MSVCVCMCVPTCMGTLVPESFYPSFLEFCKQKTTDVAMHGGTCHPGLHSKLQAKATYETLSQKKKEKNWGSEDQLIRSELNPWILCDGRR